MTETTNLANKIAKDNFYQTLKKDPLARVSVDFVVTVIFIVILFVIAIRPTIVTINKIQTGLDVLKSFNSELTTKINTLKTLTDLYQNNKQKFDLLDIAIPKETQFPLLEKQIRYLIYQNKFEVLSLTFSEIPLIQSPLKSDDTTNQGEAQDSKSANTLSFSIAANGDYESIKNYISQLQTLSRLVDIHNFTISQSTDDSKKLNFSLSAVVYYGL